MPIADINPLLREAFEPEEENRASELLGDEISRFDEEVLDDLVNSEEPALMGLAECEDSNQVIMYKGLKFGKEYIGVPAVLTCSRTLPDCKLQSVTIFVDEGKGFVPVLFSTVQKAR